MSEICFRIEGGLRRADGGEAVAVERAGAVGAEGEAVLGGGVALVGGEAVLGVDLVELAHEAVAVDLGDDGSGGDRKRKGIAVEKLGLGAVVVDAHGVDEQVVGGGGEALDGGEHGEARGLVDVDAVDGGGVDFGDRDGEGHAADALVEALAVFAGELLGVGEAGLGERLDVAREDDGGGDDGPKRAPRPTSSTPAIERAPR